MTIVAQRLSEGARTALVKHFLALPAEDRRLRFGSPLASKGIAGYIAKIDFERDTIFAVHDDRVAPVGVAHVAFGNDLAELGLSVLPAHRGRGVGSALFERAVGHARNRFIPRLMMHCLKENAPVMRIAQRFGMDIVTSFGEADGHLELPPPSPGSISEEIMADGFALYDYALKTHAAAWKPISSAVLGAAPRSRPRHRGSVRAVAPFQAKELA